MGRDPENYLTKSGVLDTITYKFRACDHETRDPCIWELWFEYPRESGEDPKLANDTVVYVLGILESKGHLDDPKLEGRINVCEFFTNMMDFEEGMIRWLADYATFVMAVDKVRRKNQVFEPRKPIPYGGPAPETKQVQASATPVATPPAVAPAPTPTPVTGDTGPQSDTILDPKPGEKVDTSFDPSTFDKQVANVLNPTGGQAEATKWPGEVTAWRLENGSAQTT